MSIAPTPIDPYPYPLTNEMADLEFQDFEIIEKKIQPLKMAPYFFRIGVPVIWGIVALLLYAAGDLTWMFGFVALFGLAIIGMSEFVIRLYKSKLKTDLINRQKRVWNGTLTDTILRHTSQSKNSSSTQVKSYVWQVSGKVFSVGKENFENASEGDQVEIEQLPESDLILRVRKIT